MELEDMKAQVKEMYQQWKLGLLNEHEKAEMRRIALEYFMEKYW